MLSLAVILYIRTDWFEYKESVMLAGHLATALVAKQHVPKGHIAFYLVASQLPDLLWQVFHFVGLEPTPEANPMLVSLDGAVPPMHYSHDLLPLIVWTALTVALGRVTFGSWMPGWLGGALVALHELTDLIGGYPHYVWGPESLNLGTGMYSSAPYVAVALEAIFTAAMLVWVVRGDRARGVQRSGATWVARAAVFGGGIVFMFTSADLSMAEATGLDPIPALDGTAMLMLAFIYLSTTVALIWGETRGAESVEPAR